MEGSVKLVEGDAREFLPQYCNIAFCFLDAEKEAYADCYEAVIPDLVPGGWLVADNAINHRQPCSLCWNGPWRMSAWMP